MQLSWTWGSGALAALACLLLANSHKANDQYLSTLASDTEEPWCDFNVLPDPTLSHDARGISTRGNVLRGSNLTELREALSATNVWALQRTWQFKAKVTSGYTTPLSFGFAGGNGFFNFTVRASASDQIIDLTEVVKCSPGETALEYRGSTPGLLSTHSVIFSDLCLRQMPCTSFEACVPSYHFQPKTTGSGDTFLQCCEEVHCSDTVTCGPSSQWEQQPDFATRLGNTKENCCKPKDCPADICNSTQYVNKSGFGILGSTINECCNPVYCADYTGCSGDNDEAKKPDRNDDGTPLLGSTDEECCNVVPCSEFNCTSSDGLWTTPAEPTGHGHSFAGCCEPLFCANFSCASTKSTDKANAPVQGNTTERCCQPIYCTNYNCTSEALVIMAGRGTRLGSTDDECCELKLCKDYTCSDLTKYVKKPQVEHPDDVLHIALNGFTDDVCCEPLYCRDFSCTSSKWSSRGLASDDETLGSTQQQCCDKILCENYTCTSDYDGDGNGTKWYKRRDTNAFKWQGSSDEECCHPLYCSQYTTEFPAKWSRKVQAAGTPAIQGSTDRECYDPQTCDKFCGCEKEGKVLRPDANNTQGSTAAECCQAVQTTTTVR